MPSSAPTILYRYLGLVIFIGLSQIMCLISKLRIIPCLFFFKEYPQNSLLDNAQQQQQHGNFLVIAFRKKRTGILLAGFL